MSIIVFFIDRNWLEAVFWWHHHDIISRRYKLCNGPWGCETRRQGTVTSVETKCSWKKIHACVSYRGHHLCCLIDCCLLEFFFRKLIWLPCIKPYTCNHVLAWLNPGRNRRPGPICLINCFVATQSFQDCETSQFLSPPEWTSIFFEFTVTRLWSAMT